MDNNNSSDPQSTSSILGRQPRQVASVLSPTISSSVTKSDHDTIGEVSNEGAADPYIALSVASQTTAATSNPVEELETLLQSQPYSALDIQATPSYAELITNSCSNNTNTSETTDGGMVGDDEENHDEEIHDEEGRMARRRVNRRGVIRRGESRGGEQLTVGLRE